MSDPPSPTPNPPPAWRVVVDMLPAIAAFALAMLYLMYRVASERIYSDEQIFLGGAGLMARGEGLIYRDFFYTHLPLHALLTAGLFRVTTYWVLAARLLDATCGAALAATLFAVGRRALRGVGMPLELAGAAGLLGIFLFNPLTAYAGGIAWNHNLSTLACVLSLIVLAAGVDRANVGRWAFASGVLAGIAATTRLTYAPVVALLPMFLLFAPRIKWPRAIALWLAGGMLAAMPSIVICLQAPAAAYFENVRYPGLTARFTGENALNSRLDLVGKAEYVLRFLRRFRSVQLLTLLSIAAGVIALRRRRSSPRVIAAIALSIACLVTAFVPTPMYQQYLYAPVPFAVLAIVWAIATLDVRARQVAAGLLLIASLVCFATARKHYDRLAPLASPSTWPPMRWHATGQSLAARVGKGKILTLMPGLPLEAGLPIYRQLSIGRYAARSADYLTPQQRADFQVPDAVAMHRWFVDDPPAAVLLPDPLTSALEESIASLAKEHGYVAEPFAPHDTAWTLYLPPAR